MKDDTHQDCQTENGFHETFMPKREECEILLAELIKEMKAKIQAEKERLKQEQSV